MTASFTVVSTFAGCGGSSLGYQMAGGKVLLAAEWDAHAIETYKLNFPTTDVFQGDVAKLSVEEVLDRTGLTPGELDIFDGSPPCQGFSTAGSREMEDPRNGLFREYVRLLKGLQPRAFVMENVSGMVKGKMRLIFVQILRDLKACGYRVSCRLLNSQWFGVPQSRPRVIFIGVREDLNIEPSHPKPQTRPVTVREALQGMTDKPDERWHCDTNTDTFKRAITLRPGETHEERFSLHRLAWDRPAPTICKSSAFLYIWHPGENRTLTISEMKRLGSFPDSFIMPPPVTDCFKRIGNSVPPLLMKAVASHIRDEILARHTSRPSAMSHQASADAR